MCKHAYLMQIILLFIFRADFGQHLVQCSNWVLSCWVCTEILFQNQFFRVAQRDECIHPAAGRQSSILELVRDVKMLKTHLYSPLPMSLSETLSTHWYWCCTTLSHTSTPSQLAKNAKCVCQICQKQIIYLICINFMMYILIFVISQGQGWCKI